MKYICLQIDYRDKTISWWDWTEKDEEKTEFNHCRRRMYDAREGQDGYFEGKISVYRYHVRRAEFGRS